MRDKSFWEKKIPTLLGILVITIAIGATSYLIGQPTFFIGRASLSATPQDIRITNVSDSSLTVSYYTSDKVLGSLNLGKDTNLSQTSIDESDQEKVKEHKIHSFTVNSLTPSTKYFFSLTSGTEKILNNGSPFEVTTAPLIPPLNKSSDFIVGRVITEEGTAPLEGIVYLTSQGFAPLSTLVKSDGTYIISFENLRKNDFSSFFQFKNDSIIKMLFISDSGSSTITLSGKDIHSVPTIILSKNYDFREENVASQSAAVNQFPTNSPSAAQNTPKITSPLENQNITTPTPTFKGTAVPSQTIKIKIESTQTIEGEVTVDSQGNWIFTPKSPLSPGQHTITIIAKDSLGILRTITQNFTIAQDALAAGGSPTSTPTATPVQSVQPTPTPVAIPIVTQTPRPTLLPTGSSDANFGLYGIAIAVFSGIFFVITFVLL